MLRNLKSLKIKKRGNNKIVTSNNADKVGNANGEQKEENIVIGDVSLVGNTEGNIALSRNHKKGTVTCNGTKHHMYKNRYNFGTE